MSEDFFEKLDFRNIDLIRYFSKALYNLCTTYLHMYILKVIATYDYYNYHNFISISIIMACLDNKRIHTYGE